ncbi:MAG: HrgA protein [Spirochaetota bacterium]|nr:HrgA protein [Spirochaetota bacterium]
MTFLELIERVLQESDIPLHYKQIWTNAVDKGYDKQLPIPNQGSRLTPWDTIGARLSVDRKKQDSIFIKTDKGFFWLKSKITPDKDLEQLEKKSEHDYEKSIGIEKIKEKDLHVILTQYLYNQSIYTKTINASTSSSKLGEMKWGTPDMVGVIFSEFLPILKKICTQLNINTIEFFAYELKVKLNSSNLTEYFFQAVSNSSWANEAWLVALDIQEDISAELERLNQSFGVGILKLDLNNPDSSKVLYPAKKRNSLDLNTMNKLINNKDFDSFLQNISSVITADDKEKRLEELIILKQLDTFSTKE